MQQEDSTSTVLVQHCVQREPGAVLYSPVKSVLLALWHSRLLIPEQGRLVPPYRIWDTQEDATI